MTETMTNVIKNGVIATRYFTEGETGLVYWLDINAWQYPLEQFDQNLWSL